MQKRSIVKNLFDGNIEEDFIFPFPTQSEEERENLDFLIDSLRKFAKEKINPKKLEEEGKISWEILNALGEMGIFGMIIPEEYEGFGMSQWAYNRVMEEMAKIDASLATMLGAHESIGVKPLLLYGNEEQKRKFLPSIAKGEKIAAFCLTEASAGSDPSSIKTKAKISDDGKYLILDGSKLFVTNGSFRGIYTVFAKLEDTDEKKDSFIALLVPGDLEGISISKEEEKLGIKASSTVEITFENVKVPKENLIGEIGKGLKIALEALDWGRLGLAAGCVGGAKELLRISSEYSRERVQFGSPISDFELIKKKLSRIAFLTYAADSMVYLTAGISERDDVDFSLESAICKTFASEILWESVNEALQVAGGYGYTKDYPYEKYLRDARINTIFEGTNEIQRLFIALYGIRGVGEYLKQMGRALKSPFTSIGILKDFAYKEIKKRIAPEKLKGIPSPLKREANMVSQYTQALSIWTERVLKRYGKKIIEKEYILERLADVAIYLYGMLATLSKTDSIIKEKSLENSSYEIMLCKAFFFEARKQIRHRISYLNRNIDDFWSEISKNIIKGKTIS
ncbi:MAG: acyl-CoA dehydrogenase family protein [Acidobacteriota bacterium]